MKPRYITEHEDALLIELMTKAVEGTTHVFLAGECKRHRADYEYGQGAVYNDGDVCVDVCWHDHERIFLMSARNLYQRPGVGFSTCTNDFDAMIRFIRREKTLNAMKRSQPKFIDTYT